MLAITTAQRDKVNATFLRRVIGLLAEAGAPIRQPLPSEYRLYRVTARLMPYRIEVEREGPLFTVTLDFIKGARLVARIAPLEGADEVINTTPSLRDDLTDWAKLHLARVALFPEAHIA